MKGVPSPAVGGGGGGNSSMSRALLCSPPREQVRAEYEQLFQTKGFWAGGGSQDTVPKRER